MRNPPFTQKGVWIHAASFGEVRAIKPVAQRVSGVLNITVATQTGYDEAVRLYPNATVRFLPFENFLPYWARAQKTLIVFDAELWFQLFFTAKKNGAKTVLLNARIPEKSLNFYMRFRWLFRRIFLYIDTVYSQSEFDTGLIRQFGAHNVQTLGNIKLLQTPVFTHIFSKPNALITVAASTHENEEMIILKAWQKSGIGGKLLIVPRHNDRFDLIYRETAAYCSLCALTFSRFSESNSIDSADITLVDQIGILCEIYAVADIAILGGSFTAKTGHNPLEPLYFGCTIISGRGIMHQQPLFDNISNIIFADISDLTEAIKSAISAPKPLLKQPIDLAAFDQAMRNVL